MSSKFTKELKELVKNQVIPLEIADTISHYYEQKQAAKPNRLFTIFGVFGALLIGSGIILMLAHNWDDLSRITRTVWAFIPLLIGQFFVGFSILKDKSRTWKEASGTFLFFAVGISIALVSQIYNISGDVGSFLQTWILLCLPLVYLLRSHAVTLLIIVFSTYYAIEIGLWNYRDRETPWWYIVFLAAIIPHYWLQVKKYTAANTTAILNWILPISVVVVLGTFTKSNEELISIMYITLFGVFYGLGKLSVFKELRTLKNGYLIIGSLGTIVLLMFFTFSWPWEEIYDITLYPSLEFYVSLFLGGIATLILGYNSIKKGILSLNLFQLSFLLFWALFFLLSDNNILSIILTNVVVFALGLNAIKIGADKFNFGILNYGMLIISILIICRFFDTEINFVIKGLIFIILGAGFFITNYIMLKKSKKRNQTQKS